MSSDGNMQNDLRQPVISQSNQAIHTSQTRPMLDIILWVIALVLLIMATMVNQYLPAYWQSATNIGVRIAVILGCIVLAMGLIYLTHQGKAFIGLLKSSQLELRRVTWPTKSETISTTWQVLIVVIIASLILWSFDTLFGWLIQIIVSR